jgi:hypothetical protein
MPIDPSAPDDSSQLPHQRLIERSSPGIENASPERLIRADGVGACPLRESGQRDESIAPASGARLDEARRWSRLASG